jgi:PAS domain S-box-containing protein/putative nucleotidyltransferase with HDIG domain
MIQKKADGTAVDNAADRKRVAELEQELRRVRENAASFEALIMSSPIGVYRTTPDGTVLMANAALAEIMGYRSVAELRERNVNEQGYAVDNYRAVFRETIERLGRVSGFESAWRRKDGTIIYIREYARVVRDEEGAIRFYEGTIENITEKTKTEMLLKESLKQIGRTFNELVETLSEAMNIRDPYTADHEKRVAALSYAIARELGHSEGFANILRTAAMLHDIGKIYVPAELLSRPGDLRKEEMDLIKVHAEAGWEILKNVSFDQPIAEMIRQHHEKMDGSGYPRGLKGDEIMLEARILAVADIVEAFSSHRPYRPAFGVPQALDQIEHMAAEGKLAPAVVDACLTLFREKGFILP